MKALSIRQPWAWAILTAGKRIENRTWATTYRGPILIHAALGMTRAEYAEFVEFWEGRFPRTLLSTYPKVPDLKSLERGGVVGEAKLIDVVRSSDSPWFFGPYGWVLADVKKRPFVACRGQLGVFDIPEDIPA